MNISARERGADLAQPSPVLAHLDFEALRAYRNDLTDEKDRIAYWTRLLKARIAPATGRSRTDAPGLSDLNRALADTGSGVRRARLTHAQPDPALPALPAVADLDGDETAVQQALDALAAYQQALQRRLSVATGDLITRYAVRPQAALDLIGPPRPTL